MDIWKYNENGNDYPIITCNENSLIFHVSYVCENAFSCENLVVNSNVHFGNVSVSGNLNMDNVTFQSASFSNSLFIHDTLRVSGAFQIEKEFYIHDTAQFQDLTIMSSLEVTKDAHCSQLFCGGNATIGNNLNASNGIFDDLFVGKSITAQGLTVYDATLDGFDGKRMFVGNNVISKDGMFQNVKTSIYQNSKGTVFIDGNSHIQIHQSIQIFDDFIQIDLPTFITHSIACHDAFIDNSIYVDKMSDLNNMKIVGNLDCQSFLYSNGINANCNLNILSGVVQADFGVLNTVSSSSALFSTLSNSVFIAHSLSSNVFKVAFLKADNLQCKRYL